MVYYVYQDDVYQDAVVYYVGYQDDVWFITCIRMLCMVYCVVYQDAVYGLLRLLG